MLLDTTNKQFECLWRFSWHFLFFSFRVQVHGFYNMQFYAQPTGYFHENNLYGFLIQQVLILLWINQIEKCNVPSQHHLSPFLEESSSRENAENVRAFTVNQNLPSGICYILELQLPHRLKWVDLFFMMDLSPVKKNEKVDFCPVAFAYKCKNPCKQKAYTNWYKMHFE